MVVAVVVKVVDQGQQIAVHISLLLCSRYKYNLIEQEIQLWIWKEICTKQERKE